MSIKILRAFSLIFIFLFSAFGLQCKKNSTAPQIDDLTRSVIWINVSELSFSASKTGNNPSAQILKIKNIGENSLDYTISEDIEWLSVEPTNGSSSGEDDVCEHTVSVQKEGLTASKDPYTATLSVVSPQSYNNPQEVKVNLMITKEPPPKIAVTPKNLSFIAQKGSSDPSPQKIIIRNSGEGTLRYEITSDQSWLSVTPESGQSKTNPKTHTVMVDIGAMNQGTYNGTLTIRDPNASNNPREVGVTVNITKEPLPKIWVSTNRLNFRAPVGSNPSTQSIRIRNSGGGILRYRISSDQSFVNVNPTNGSSSGDENRHIVSINSSGLTAGNYFGTLTVSDPDATNNPYYINVNLEMTAPMPTNRISIWCSPSSASKGTIVDVPVKIEGNQSEIQVFGLDLYFDTNMFEYHSCDKGDLTSSWVAVAGNEISSGVIRAGGFKGSAPTIPTGSVGTIAVIKLRVTGDSYANGQQSELRITNYTDDISSMIPNPARTTFTLQK